MANSENNEWTVVKSKFERSLEKKIHREISNNSIEKDLFGSDKLFKDDKPILNNKILKNKDAMKFIRNNFQINKNIISRLNSDDFNLLAKKFKKKEINLDNFTCLSYPYKLGIIDTEEYLLGDFIHGWKISLKDEGVFQVLLFFKTDIPKLPYSFVRYIQTKSNVIKKECVLLNNYLEVLLFLYRHELNLVLKKKTLVSSYPMCFFDINKEKVNSYFLAFRKIRRKEIFN